MTIIEKILLEVENLKPIFTTNPLYCWKNLYFGPLLNLMLQSELHNASIEGNISLVGLMPVKPLINQNTYIANTDAIQIPFIF